MRRGSLDLALALLCAASAARALDPFEIQVYDGTANPKGGVGLELHLNVASSAGHFTLEPSYGLTDFWELGGYLQSALRSDGTFEYAGVKLRSKLVTVAGFDPRWRLGVNLELSLLPQRYDPNSSGGEIRPIAAWESELFLFALNPIFGLSFGGTGLRNGPTFEPAAMVKVKLKELIALGVEYYGDLGALGAIEPLRGQQHYLFETIDVIAVKRLEINLGIGQGLTARSTNWVLKGIVGWTFEPRR